MSKIMIESRMCDQCETSYAENYTAWMTLTFPNVVTEDDAPEFDFCTYECLQAWVNEEDEENESPQPSQALVEANERFDRLMETAGVGGQDSHVAVVEALTVQAPQPTFSLAEALARGLRPGNPIEG